MMTSFHSNSFAGAGITGCAETTHGVPLRHVVWEIAHDVMVLIDADGYLSDVNPACTRTLGWTSRHVGGMSFVALFASDHREILLSVLETVRRDASTTAIELPTCHADGSLRWISWIFSGVDEFVYASGHDVSIEKQRAQRADMMRKTSEVRLELALEAGSMGAWQWDMVTNESAWSAGMFEVHGLPPTTAPGSVADYVNLVHPEDRQFVAETAARTMSTGGSHCIEYRVMHPAGGIRWIEALAKVVMDEAGMPICMAGICLDVTRHKRIEQDLRFAARASAELASLTDYETTLDRIARLAVPAFADWCAVDMLDAEGRPQRVAVAHVDPGKVELAHDLHRRYPPDPAQTHGTFAALRDGKTQYVPEITDGMLEASIDDPDRLAAVRRLGLHSYIGTPLFSMGKPVGVVTFITAESRRRYDADDVALAEDLARRASVAIENVALYRELREVDRRKDIFLATLAHELRNPLAPISNALALLKSPSADREIAVPLLEVMERQVSSLKRLVEDLLDVSRITSGKIELRKERTDLRTVLNAALETSRPHIDEAGHELAVRLPDSPIHVEGDPLRLAQVFANLLNNAARYTPPGGTITLSLDCEGEDEDPVVRVRDDGIGIERDMLDKIFSVFTQVHPLENDKGGLGIGLSIVEGLVKLHGGAVNVYSEGMNLGSEFVVRLPRAASAPSRASAPCAADGDAAPAAKRVLVVDDNVDAADSTADLLRIFGYDVTVANSGASALERMTVANFDTVLLDIGMPVMDGYETARRMRERESGRNMRLIALTGWGGDNEVTKTQQAGFDEHWVKPIDVERLKYL